MIEQIIRWLRLEGAVVLVVSVWGYASTDASWWLFVALLLVPDLFMLGYLAGPRLGAVVYNIGHAYLLPALLGAASIWLAQPLLLSLALIWVAHIGMDRMLGYGLKFPDHFKHTHLGFVGKPEKLAEGSP